MRGEALPVGSERVAQNGYRYVKTDDGEWRLKHHIIAEETLGRAVDTSVERIYFIDKNKTNFAPSNIGVAKKKGVSNATKRARLEARLEEIQGQLAELDEEEAS